jgi:membrane fusion protein, heavy metal efflux system
MRTKILTIISVFSITLIVGCNTENKNNQPSKNNNELKKEIVTLKKESIKEIKLELTIAEEKKINGSISVPAELVPNQDYEAQVGTLIKGRVHKVFVKLGDFVNQDQPLMQIEGIEIGEIKSQFIKAKAQADFADANLKRQKTLTEQKVGSLKAMQEAQAEYDKAVAEFNAADKKIHSVGLSDEEVINNGNGESHIAGLLTIKAPISGIVVERNVVIGQLIDESKNAFRIVNNSVFWADGQLYEKDIPLVQGKSEITMSVTAFPREVFRGKIIYVGEVVDDRTRTIKVRAEINNLNRKLKSDMYGEMLIPVNENKKGIVVPSESLIKENNKNFLFVAQNDTTFEMREVQLGILTEDAIEIISGIRSGEKIVSKGAFYLKSEMKKSELTEE